jgi:hypothetical protein
MLRSEDVGVHYEAVGVIGNLVHSSQVGRTPPQGRRLPAGGLLNGTILGRGPGANGSTGCHGA